MDTLAKKYKQIDFAKIVDEVRVFAPATVANMICGFDILGFAVDYPGDEVHMYRVPEPGVRIRSIRGDDGRLPLDADRNTVSRDRPYQAYAHRQRARLQFSEHRGGSFRR
jgi:homoserine kinase